MSDKFALSYWHCAFEILFIVVCVGVREHRKFMSVSKHTNTLKYPLNRQLKLFPKKRCEQQWQSRNYWHFYYFEAFEFYDH